MDIHSLVKEKTLDEIIRFYPIAYDFLLNLNIDRIPKDRPINDALKSVDDAYLEEFGLERYDVPLQLVRFLETFILQGREADEIYNITIIGGRYKNGDAEDISIDVSIGEVVSIVGPTGSGKSQLLEDIECIAQQDTPTGRRVLINGRELDEDERFNMGGKLVAQLSQNMNFVMDLTVREFLEMHAKSRLTNAAAEAMMKCFQCANELAGEQFEADTKVTQLSGGQSRALMIADVAYMSSSPIVLIDEIENAGIDRKQAISLLAKKEKIVFVSTHDPLLALTADKRLIIKNGGIHKIIVTSEKEKESLKHIELIDNRLMSLRNSLRKGDMLEDVGII